MTGEKNITKTGTSAREVRLCTVYRSSGERVLTSKMSPRRLHTGVKSPEGGFIQGRSYDRTAPPLAHATQLPLRRL